MIMSAEPVAAVVCSHPRRGADGLSITVPAEPGTSATGPHAAVIGESVRNLAEAHFEEMNRSVRTRTPGGVGGASEQSGSLSRLSLFALLVITAEQQLTKWSRQQN